MQGENVPQVLHVISSTARRGAEVFAADLADALDSQFSNSLVALSASSYSESPLDVEVLGENWKSVPALRALRARMRTASVIVAHGSVTLPATVLAGVGLKVPIIYKNIGDPWFWSTSSRRRWQSALLLRRVKYVAALTDSSARAVMDCWRVPANRVVVTGGGRDATRFRRASTSERAAARRELELDPERRVVLFVGALSVEKRPELAVAVAGCLPDIVLLVAGDGPLRDDVESLARESAAEVRILGMRSDIRRLLRAADALIMTSASEGLPGTLIEAGLAGLPVVATDVGYVRDVVNDGVTGFIVDSTEPRKLAEALQGALERRVELGAQARSWCEEHFDISVSHARWLSLLRRVLNGG